MRGTVHFDLEHPLFADHFPDAPVVPGTLVIQAFLELATAHMPSLRITGARRFRFRRFVSPGIHDWTMNIEKNTITGEKYLLCGLSDQNGTMLVSGNLLVEDRLS